MPRLTRPTVWRWAGGLGRLVYRLARRDRRIALANLEIAFGSSLSPAEKERIAGDSFRNFARTLFDAVWFAHDASRRIPQWVSIPDDALRQLAPGRPQILVTAHLGNWEVLGQALSLAGISLMSVAAPLANPAADRLFVRLRERTGQKIVPRKGAVRPLLQHLRRAGKVALLLDQNTKPEEGGVFVQFFGRPVPVSTAAAWLALRTGAEICFGYALPTVDGHYHAHLEAVIHPKDAGPGDTGEAVERLTQQLAEVTERTIRRFPQFWLWSYKRWKYIAPGWSPNAYPFYAHP